MGTREPRNEDWESACLSLGWLTVNGMMYLRLETGVFKWQLQKWKPRQNHISINHTQRNPQVCSQTSCATRVKQSWTKSTYQSNVSGTCTWPLQQTRCELHWLIDWYFISKKCTYINSTYKQIKSSMCMQRYMYHLVAARETTASLSKLAAFRLNSTWSGLSI